MNEIRANQLIQQMRLMSLQARGEAARAPVEGKAAERPDFGALLQQSLNAVNSQQQKASQMAEALERGEPGVNLAQVMVEVQKASVSFQALNTVRNKMLAAYQEIMNMQV
ncbi:MAG: flagellar hook-basal body complex protein FliE [Gammaproteobacteria bacterium]|nr:MAG: flagellar hook-basal body complex protein FliE [Gammaproteobacteria bacterium]